MLESLTFVGRDRLRLADAGIFFVLVVVGCSKNTPPQEDFSGETGPLPIVSSLEAREYSQQCLKKYFEGSPKETVAVSSHRVVDGAYRWSTLPYELKPKPESVSLKVKVGIHYVTSSETTESAKARMEKTVPCIAAFFGRHGITLDASFLEENTENSVTFHDNGIRPSTFNAFHWAFSMDGMLLEDGLACTTFTHEFSHLLGLVDEYEDAQSPERYVGEMDSVMRNTGEPLQVKFYPRHIQAFLNPLCPVQ